MTSQPRMCYDVEKILGVSNEGNVRCYKVQWAPVWVSSLHLFGCENLIQEFLQKQQDDQQQAQQQQQQAQSQQKPQAHQDQQQQQQQQQQQPQQQNLEHIEPTNIVGGTYVDDIDVPGTDTSPDALQDEGVSNFHTDNNSLHHGGTGSDEMKHHIDLSSTKSNSTSQPETFTMVSVKEEMVDDISESVDSYNFDIQQQPQSHQDSYKRGEWRSMGLVSESQLGPQTEFYSSSCINTFETTEQKVFFTMAGFPQSSASYPDVLNDEPEDIYNCETCEKSFSSEKKLHYHKKYTLSCGGQRPAPHKCDYCDARFVSKCHLKVHERTHTKEKPYQCTECDKAFAVKSNLRVHMHIHSGERRFACENCGQTFNQGGNRNQHYKRCIQK